MEEKIIYSIEFEGNDELIAEMAKIRKENNLLKQANKEYTTALRKGEEVTNEQAKAFEKNTVQIKKNNRELLQMTKQVAGMNNTVKKAETRLSDLRAELTEMALAGDKSSDAFIAMRNEASTLQDQIDKVNAEVRVFADDALVINTVVDATAGLAQGFQMVQSAQAMLGFESEKFEEVMQKLVATQTFINSLQGVSNMLQKDSRVVLVAKAVAVKAVTAAQWLWNAAMTANPIGAIIVGIAALGAGIYALIKNFDKVTDAVKKAWEFMSFWKKSGEEADDVNNELISSTDNYTESQKKLNKELEKTVKNTNAIIDSKNFELRLLKAMGAEEDKIIEKERELLQLNLENAEAAYNAAIANSRATGQQATNLSELLDNMKEARRELKVFNAEKKALEEQQYQDEFNRAKLAQAQLNVLIEDNLDNQIALATIKHEQKIASRDDWTKEELALERYKHQQLLNETKKYYDEDGKLIDENYQDELNRAELAQAQLNVLIEDNLDNQIDLATIKHQQKIASRDDWTKEELALLRYKHQQELEELNKFYDEEGKLIDENKYNYQEEWEAWLLQKENENMTELQMIQHNLDSIEQLRQDDLLNEETYIQAKKILLDELAAKNRETAISRMKSEQMARNAVVQSFAAITDAFSEGGKEMNAFALFAKKLALANSIINIAQGLTASLKLGFPQNIVAVAGYVAQTAGIISQIKNQNVPKYAHGGYIGGKPHSMGGTKYYGEDGNVFEAEKGEYLAIINKYDAQRAAAFDAINQQHGVSINAGGNYFARGGSVMPSPRQDFQGFNMTDMVRDVVNQISSIPVVNDVRETRDIMRKVENIEKAGDLN